MDVQFQASLFAKKVIRNGKEKVSRFTLYWWFACDVMAAMLVDRNSKIFSPVGVNFYFYANYVNKFSFVFVHKHGGNENPLFLVSLTNSPLPWKMPQTARHSIWKQCEMNLQQSILEHVTCDTFFCDCLNKFLRRGSDGQGATDPNAGTKLNEKKNEKNILKFCPSRVVYECW